MEYRLTALGLKLVLVAFVTAVIGFGVWVVGQVAITSLWLGNDLADSLNAVLSFGLIGGVAAAWIGPRVNGTRVIEATGIAGAFVSAIVGAWFGSVFLADALVPSGPARFGPPGIGEVFGAIAGALLGALALPVVIGGYRVMKRLEP